MVQDKIVVVVGMGEVGRPLFEILNKCYECLGIDKEAVEVDRACSVLHICYPFQIPEFVGTTVAYIEKYQPDLAIINSTVAIGTTREVQDRVNRPVVYSPVRGKHVKMEQDMMLYKKFVGGFEEHSTHGAAEHFKRAGFETDWFRTPEAGELSKMVETTWLGVLIAWAQEIERFALDCGASYDDINAFIKEIGFLPSHVFPGLIGGHCVMPNIALLRTRFRSAILEAVVESNRAKENEKQTLNTTREDLRVE